MWAGGAPWLSLRTGWGRKEADRGKRRKTFRRVKVSGHGYMPGVRGRIFSRPVPKKKKSAAPSAATPGTAKGGGSTTSSTSSLTEDKEESKG